MQISRGKRSPRVRENEVQPLSLGYSNDHEGEQDEEDSHGKAEYGANSFAPGGPRNIFELDAVAYNHYHATFKHGLVHPIPVKRSV